ncbi:MAG: hypothetical protein SF182_05500 [Deltaproteobacteria bacterium]|nr:hypothetical protein [Deltaproteobacteria bacterium]
MTGIDMTAELGSIVIALNVALVVSALALVVSEWVTGQRTPTSRASHRLTETETAIVRFPTRGTATTAAPLRVTSVPEAV